MKILIIGSKGFIGSHCISFFRQKQYEVWGCDVVTDYTEENYFVLDASNSDFSTIFKDQSFDVCINCSGAASVPDSIQHPKRDYLLNAVNVFFILDAIRLYNSDCKFLNMSTAAVYGNPQSLPIAETHKVQPVSPYGLHKKQAEEICSLFANEYSIKTCSARIFSAYGPGLHKQLFWDLAQKSQQNDALELFGSGNESRDFIYILDLIAAFHLIIEKGVFDGSTYNVASGIESRISEVVQLFYSLYNPRVQYKFMGKNRSGDPLNWCADISKITALGFVPNTDLKTGLTHYVSWLNEKI